MANISVAIIYDEITDLSSAKTFLPLPSMTKDEMTTRAEPMPFWLSGGSNSDSAVFLTVDRNGVIAGTVKVQGNLQVKSKVMLYFRKSGGLIQTAHTNNNGAFEFACGLNRNASDYFVVAITEQPFNAQVFDKLTPA